MLKRNDDGQAAEAFYEKRRQWLDYICGVPELSDRAFRVGYWLAKRMNGEDQCCWYTHKQIAKALKISNDKVIRAVAELCDEGVMFVVREHRRPNHYFIRMPYEIG